MMTPTRIAAIVMNASSFVSAAPAKAIAAMNVSLATIAAAPIDRNAMSIASAFPPPPENACDAHIAAVQNAVASQQFVSQRMTGTAAASQIADIDAAVIHGSWRVKSAPHASTIGTSGGYSTRGGG